MVAHFDIEQGTEEWYKIRWGKVSGTRAKGLFTDTDTLLLTLLSEITEEFELEDGYTTDDMQRGKDLEPLARRSLSAYIQTELIEAGWLQSTKHPLLGISIDGISKDLSVTAEIKCPGAKKHIETVLGDCIPIEHIHQCLHAFSVNPSLKTHYFCSFRPEFRYRTIFVKSITLYSIVNIGTKAKPISISVSEYVEKSHAKISALQEQINNSIDKLSF